MRPESEQDELKCNPSESWGSHSELWILSKVNAQLPLANAPQTFATRRAGRNAYPCT